LSVEVVQTPMTKEGARHTNLEMSTYIIQETIGKVTVDCSEYMG